VLLVVDIGNTNIVFGVFRGDELVGQWRISTQQQRTADEYGILILDLFGSAKVRAKAIRGLAISSVVPPLTPVFSEIGEKYFSLSPLLVSHRLKTGLTLKIKNAQEIGADRIVNAAAAFRIWGGPVIIVDFGTATTFCAVSKKGEYLGGAIAPGLMISAEALFARAAKLQKIEISRPPSVIGRDTASAMQSGLIFGYAGLVDEIVNRMEKELGTATVVATGGVSQMIVPVSKTIQKTHPTLTLEGLRIIYGLNRGEIG
jgi:type III pantothenate kinase